MGVQAVDYRISKVVVCCKDCGQDVGLYPARHKCQDVNRPPLPPLPTTFGDDLKVPRKPGSPSDNDSGSRPISATSTSSSTFTYSNNLSDASSVTSTGSKWSRFGRSNPATATPAPNNNKPTDDENEESIYFNNFAAHLPEGDSTPTGVAGKKLWGKVKQNDKWKQLNEKYEKPKQSTKLWGKFVQATQNMAEKKPAYDDHGPDSDESDWEGESHVSRILREHYERKHERLPHWLFDKHTPEQVKTQTTARDSRDSPQNDNMDRLGQSKSLGGRKQRLWESSEPKMTQREREREELRQQRHVQNTTPISSMDAPEERVRYNTSYSDENPRYARSGGRYDDQYQRSPPSSGARYDNHQRSPPSSGKYDDYQRSPSSGGRYDSSPSGDKKYEDYQRFPQGGGGRYDDYRRSPANTGGRSRYAGYEDDGNDSRPYPSERRAPPMRSRSPAKTYQVDSASDYFSYDERGRGPREIPSHSYRAERAGGHF